MKNTAIVMILINALLLIVSIVIKNETIENVLLFFLIAINISYGFYLYNKFFKRINILSDKIETMAGENRDLTLKLDIEGKDEIGKISSSVNKIVDNLRNTITQIEKKGEEVASLAEQLSTTSTYATEGIGAISKSIQEVANSSRKQTEDSNNSVHSVNEMVVGINRVVETTNIVSETSEETAKEAEFGNEKIKRVINQMESISGSANRSAEEVGKLGDLSNKIGEIVNVITSFSNQTNLLALNAAIEAARAGEQGKGFAVVAEEVRKLAEDTTDSANEISNLIKEIQKNVSSAIDAMDKGKTEVASGLTVVNEAGEAFDRILNATKHVARQIFEVSSASEEILMVTNDVSDSIENTAEIAKNLMDYSQEVATSAEEQSSSIKQISDSADYLSQVSKELKESIQDFKTK